MAAHDLLDRFHATIRIRKPDLLDGWISAAHESGLVSFASGIARRPPSHGQTDRSRVGSPSSSWSNARSMVAPSSTRSERDGLTPHDPRRTKSASDPAFNAKPPLKGRQHSARSRSRRPFHVASRAAWSRRHLLERPGTAGVLSRRFATPKRPPFQDNPIA